MSKYPKLKEMGVNHPQHIVKYSVNSVDFIDVLRIVYKRPKGSVLPETRTYKFPRVQKTPVGKDGKPASAVVMESDPCLRAAVEELRTILAAREEASTIAELILEELRLLQEDVDLRSNYINDLVGKIKLS
ncbi:MAG: DUF3461 family protein [Gammaproteobacteria bacterium]|nr:DUF3461 family protein [Gammaproteobacteria bacterium]